MVSSTRVAHRPRLIGLLILGGMLAMPGIGADDYLSWAHHARLTLDTGPQGADVAGDVAGFPLLVRLTRNDFPFAEASSQGRDLRFSDASGRHLPYQIDSWDSLGGTAEIWVKVDIVKGDSTDQFLDVHWGMPSAVDSSAGPVVFDSSAGFVAAWHLGGTGPRPNSVAGGNPAVPKNHSGSGSKAGVIGMADSLSGNSQEAYLDLGAGYSGFRPGFTFSTWIYPTDAGSYTHFLDLGNGDARDNIVLQRQGTSRDIGFVNYAGSTQSDDIVGAAALNPNQWQHFAVTVNDKDARIFRNGVQIAAATLTVAINGTSRSENFLGKSSSPDDNYFKGKLDEPWLARTPRSADWIKLSYENQKPGQRMVYFRTSSSGCQARFEGPSDSTHPEGSILSLEGVADCASSFWWSQIGGLPIRILDPDAKTLQVNLPRVSMDTSVRFRFSARFGDSISSRDVRIGIANTIPEPEFTLPPRLDWNGTDTLVILPVIANHAAVKTSLHPDIRFAWELDSTGVDTSWMESALILKSSPIEGKLTVKLCLDNQAEPVCRSTEVTIRRPAGIEKMYTPSRRFRFGAYPYGHGTRDAKGRAVRRGPEPPTSIQTGHQGLAPGLREVYLISIDRPVTVKEVAPAQH